MMRVCGFLQNTVFQPIEKAADYIVSICRRVRSAVSGFFLLFCRWWEGGQILPTFPPPAIGSLDRPAAAGLAPLQRRDVLSGNSDCPPNKQAILSVFAAIEEFGPSLRAGRPIDIQRSLEKGKTIASILEINARDVAFGTMYPHFRSLNIHYFPSQYEVGLRSDHLPNLIERVKLERPGKEEDLAIFVTQGQKHHAFALFEKEGRWWLFDPVGRPSEPTILWASYETLGDVQRAMKWVLGPEDGYFEVLPVERWQEPQLP